MKEKTILQIDDSETICTMIKMILAQKPGYKVIQAGNGEEGLEKFKGNKVSLVITDINMPKMNGLELIKQVRKLDAEVPILVLSTESEEGLRKQGQEYGANGWIVKPFKPAQFSDIIEQIL